MVFLKSPPTSNLRRFPAEVKVVGWDNARAFLFKSSLSFKLARLFSSFSFMIFSPQASVISLGSFPLISLSLPKIGLFPLSSIWASFLSCDFIYRLLFVTYPHANLCPPYLTWSYMPLTTFFHMFFIRGFSVTRTRAERDLRILVCRSCGVNNTSHFY